MEGEGGLIEREGGLGPVGVSLLSFVHCRSSCRSRCISPLLCPPWTEAGGRLLLPFVGDIGGLWVGMVGGHVRCWWVVMCRGCHSQVLVVGCVRCWWGLVMGARPCLCCLIVCLHLSLAGDGGGCSCSPSPSFVSPGCALPFAVGGGCSPLLVSPRWVLVSAVCGSWWWVLVVALALLHVASLCAPVGGGCSDPFVSPHWVLMSAIGGGW